MNDDLIRRQDAIDACCFGITHAKALNIVTGEVVDLFAVSNKELHKAIERIEALQPAEPQREIGKWIELSHGILFHVYKCDHCGNTIDMNGVNAGRGYAKYCPSCGARMGE